ncbi:MAG: T9SS type A sorting domain-containing protein, partial [Ginsengibacter sp.]
GAGIVTSIKGDYPAATPTTQIQNLVSGGSGNGSSSYSGSTSSYDNFTACPVPANYPVTNATLAVGGFNSEQVTQTEIISSPIKGMVQIVPNPASSYIMVSFVPSKSGNSRIALFRIDGKMVYESQNGLYQAGKNYMQRIDVSKYPSGIYLVQITNVDKIITNKIIITR